MPGTSSSSEPGIAREVARPPETCTILSLRPWITSVGTVSSRSRAVRSGCVRIASICRATPAALTPRSQVSPARSRTASLGVRVARRADDRPEPRRAVDVRLAGAGAPRASSGGQQPRVLPADRAAAGGGHDRGQRPHPLGLQQRHRLHDHAAHRDADDVRGLDAEVVEQAEGVAGQVVERVRRPRACGARGSSAPASAG